MLNVWWTWVWPLALHNPLSIAECNSGGLWAFLGWPRWSSTIAPELPHIFIPSHWTLGSSLLPTPTKKWEALLVYFECCIGFHCLATSQCTFSPVARHLVCFCIWKHIVDFWSCEVGYMGSTSSIVQRLLLALSSGITLGGARGSICSAMGQSQVIRMPGKCPALPCCCHFESQFLKT